MPEEKSLIAVITNTPKFFAIQLEGQSHPNVGNTLTGLTAEVIDFGNDKGEGW